MNFQKRMVMAFSALILAASVIFGFIYYTTIKNNYIETEKNNLQTAADNYAQQFAYTVGQMEEVISQILSNQEALKAIQILSHEGNSKKDKTYYYTEARRTLRAVLNADYYKKSFNRVVLFMQNGTVISGTNYKYNPVDAQMDINGIGWLDELSDKRGKYVLLGMHQDDWDKENGRLVISAVKEILGENLGYLEVQKEVEAIDELFVPGNDKWSLYVLQGEKLLYSSSKDVPEMAEILEAVQEESEGPGTRRMNSTGELTAVSQIQSNQLRVVIADHTLVSREAMKKAFPFTAMIVILMGTGLFACICFMSRHMVKPIRQLKQQMEQTDIENMKVSEQVVIADKEIGKLYDAYINVLRKLEQSIRKERLLSELQQKAQFDLLQAQVNPHFLFNVLNVISSRGAEADDEVICDICSDLAQMLRYSTDVKEKRARLEEEVHYLRLYLTLLKFRYEDMLEYRIDIEEPLYGLEIPKMVLQQIVENSVSHGYQDVDRIKRICVCGSRKPDGWVIQIRDNGTGMSKEKIQEIYARCGEIREALSEKRSHVEMGIGGMGLVNTYARLYQIYGEDFFMEIRTFAEGVEVAIGVRQQGGISCTRY